MARNRQRAKDRQAQRRAERLERQGESGERGPNSADEVLRDEALTDGDLHELADLEVGAPPEDIGRSDSVMRHAQPPPPDFESDDQELYEDEEDDEAGAVAAGPRGVRGGRDVEHHHERGRLAAFLVAVWAELQRVQWPNRRELSQLTGVVLFFVIVVGAYLGGLDAVFSRLVSAIL